MSFICFLHTYIPHLPVVTAATKLYASSPVAPFSSPALLKRGRGFPLQAHMSSDQLPMSAAGAGAASSRASTASSPSWLDTLKKVFEVVKKVYELVKKLIPIIKNCFSMTGASTSTSSTKDILTQLTNVLPTGTFMAFQLIAPLATNSGACGSTERIVTGTLLAVFAAMVTISTFTDSVKIPSTGKVYYGLVTSKGLWNPSFQGVPGAAGNCYTSGGDKYKVKTMDFVNAVMSLAAFAALALLSDPVAKCYFKGLSTAVEKSVPLIVGAVVSFVLGFTPAARNGIGFRVDASPEVRSGALLEEPVRSTAKE